MILRGCGTALMFIKTRCLNETRAKAVTEYILNNMRPGDENVSCFEQNKSPPFHQHLETFNTEIPLNAERKS